MSLLEALVTGAISGLVLIPVLYLMYKGLEKRLDFDNLLYSFLENASKDPNIQAQCQSLGAYLGNGVKLGLGVNQGQKYRKNDLLGTGLMLAEQFGLIKMPSNSENPSPPPGPTSPPPPLLTQNKVPSA